MSGLLRSAAEAVVGGVCPAIAVFVRQSLGH